jgi:phenylpropionate dioxygenase-like ring-hydroxylating dioxygenase large terminal subunit
MYTLFVHENEEIKKQVWELLEKGFIWTTTSPCGSPIVLVQKNDGTWRMCVDF